MTPEQTVRQLATLHALVTDMPQHSTSPADIAAEHKAEDVAWERRHGHVDEGVTQRRESAYEVWLGGAA